MKFFILHLLAICLVVGVTSAHAAKRKKRSRKISTPIETSLIVDGKSGKILHSRNARKKIYPASLTKVMTIYLLFESLESGKYNKTSKLKVSKHASKALPSKLYLQPGSTISVRDAALALTVKSANDVARVVAENIAGSESKFARLMTIRARQLGMKDTVFVNASGWHDPKQVTTAVDMAKLAIAVKRDFPQYYPLFKETSFKFKGKTIRGHNKVAANYPGAEGLKTGYHRPAGFNLITTATRGRKSFVGVVTGRKNSAVRDKKMVELLDQHFNKSTGKSKKRSRSHNV